MTETTLCLPCALALRPPVTEPPHHCPGQVRLVSGTGQVRVVLCECRICWPDRAKEQPPRQSIDRSAGSSADLSGEPLDDLGVRQQPEGGTG
ncbi:hypothetical protein [Plantactinospora sp. BB1]|uniref:hypothetical protein n=1 Tax=Plantactinospora sp. BB1 TaxID=2071627 RepID=UPI00131ED95A|nr:hypothetical protein [Plantactinospora sp. BB1]